VTITAQTVKELRDRTGAGFMDCKAALSENAGDVEAAIDYLRKKGIAAAARKAHRETGEGLVESYIHPGGRIGVLIEVNCETDFVARTEDFQAMVKDLAMQVAAASPLYLGVEDIPEEALAREKEVLLEQARESGKPENVLEKIVEGRLKKYYEEACLLEQKFVKDTDLTVQDVVKDAIAKLGENIRVRRFQRFQLGGN
jgi:elongation factor Ts